MTDTKTEVDRDDVPKIDPEKEPEYVGVHSARATEDCRNWKEPHADGKTLGCWCQRIDENSPACHAEVIAEHADRLADQEATA